MLSFIEEIILLMLCVSLPNFVVTSNPLEEKSSSYGEQSSNNFEDLQRKKNGCIEFINLNVSAVSNKKYYFVDISFEVSDPKFNDCFDYYNITLRNLKEREVVAKMVKYDKEVGASHRFKNVECGTYNLTIQACFLNWVCYPLFLDYGLVNMKGIECLEIQVSNKLLTQQQGKAMIVIITIVSVLLILAVGAMSFCFYWSAEQKCKLKDFIVKKKDGTVISVDYHIPENEEPSRRNEVIILHHYNERNNEKVHLLQDFLRETDYFESVTTIECLLSRILFDVKEWLDKMLKTSKEDGGMRKIILIASEIDAEARDNEMENLLFSNFLDKINDDSEKCLKGYDHLFVVQFEKQLTNYPEVFRNIVRRDRYTLSGLFEDQLIDLCINLCSESDQNMLHAERIERYLRALFTVHSIQRLDNPLFDV